MNRIGWQFDPDLVVVQWLVNDVYPSGTGFQAERIWPPVPHLLPEAFRAGAIRDSDLYGFLQQRYTSFKLGTRYTAYAALYNDTNPDWIANQRAFRELGDSARARGVPVVLMIWPTIGTEVWTSETHPQRDIHALVAKVATEAGLHVFDLTSAFGVAGGDPKRWWARPYDRHPSPQADSLAVHELLGFLAGHRLDPRSVAQGIR